MNWLERNKSWETKPIWKPSEHTEQYHDTFKHIYELGDKDHPIEIDDDGWFTSYEYVTDGGIINYKSTWNDLPDYQKRYWQEDWWYEKPWDLLYDPGESSMSKSSGKETEK